MATKWRGAVPVLPPVVRSDMTGGICNAHTEPAVVTALCKPQAREASRSPAVCSTVNRQWAEDHGVRRATVPLPAL